MRRRPFTILGLGLIIAASVLLLVSAALTIFVVSHFDGSAQSLEQGRPYFALRAPWGRGVGQICGLVFGAAVHRNSLPGPGIARRVETAARLYREGFLQHIILSGGKGEEGVASEAQVMRDVALEDGIPKGDLTLEGDSRSTWENLKYSRPLTGSCVTVIGISDRYHLARITFLARLQGWGSLQTFPSDLEPPWPFEMKSIAREVAAMVYYIILSPFVRSDYTTSALPLTGQKTSWLYDHETYSFDLSIEYLT